MLHHKERNSDYCALSATVTFKCIVSDYFSYFKLTQLGTNRYNYDYQMYHFALNKVELQGKLEIPFVRLSCPFKRESNIKLISLVLFHLS